MYTYKEMEERTRAFYSTLGITLSRRDLPLAIQSLSMPRYTRRYNEATPSAPLHDNDSLATLGDSVFYVYVLTLCFSSRITERFLTDKKIKYCSNDTMKVYGEDWLADWLFATHKDLYEEGSNQTNKKGYATAFEAVVGFLYLRAPDRVMEILRNRFPRAKMEEAYHRAKDIARLYRATQKP